MNLPKNIIRNKLYLTNILIFCFIFFNCSKLREDVIINNTSCIASECHPSTNLKKALPTTGKHPEHINGIDCTKCHYNYLDNSYHKNGILDADIGTLIVYFDSSNPTGSWNDSVTTCENISCHVDADWNGAATFTCSDCHSSVRLGRRQAFGAGGDFQKDSHHVINYSSRNAPGIVTNADCVVCHDQANHASGVVRLKDKDNAGQVIVYNPAVPSSLEPFCLSCHDVDGALTEAVPMKPFNALDPNTLGIVPNRAGTEIKSAWDSSYGHKQAGVTCMGTGSPGTGCHGDYAAGKVNAHGSSNYGLLVNKMTFPVTNPIFDDSNYQLCNQCHENTPTSYTIANIAGVGDGSNYGQTHAAGYNQFPYLIDNTVTAFHDYETEGAVTGTPQFNLHLFHLVYPFWESWEYRGDTSSFLSCTTCHNVHGTAQQYSYLWDEWGFYTETELGVEYGRMPDFAFDNSSYPQFCGMSCHGVAMIPRYPRSQFNEAKAIAYDTSGLGAGLHNGDTVVIYFSDSTNGPPIDKNNIDAVLLLSGSHTWVDSTDATGVTAVWSSTGGKTNNVLTVTLIDDLSGASPTVAAGDTITFDEITITDATAGSNPIPGVMNLRGSL